MLLGMSTTPIQHNCPEVSEKDDRSVKGIVLRSMNVTKAIVTLCYFYAVLVLRSANIARYHDAM